MTEWQIELINTITIENESYDAKKARRLATEWRQTDEKWCFIMDNFAMSANDRRVDYWVERIEDQFELILLALDKNQ